MTFDEWLNTHEGRSCASWPVDGPEYLKNRLRWAFRRGEENNRAPIITDNRMLPITDKPEAEPK